MAGPLDGVVVVDFTEYVAGPYGTMMLADLGAEVLKVEPYEGDHWRRQQPVAPHESRYYVGVNRGKKSIAARIETPEGRELVADLVRRADVVVVNYRPETVRDFGLDYETLRAYRPDLIYCSITAFGTEGPYRDRPGFDLLLQAMSGIVDFEKKMDRGVPTQISTYPPADLSTAMFAAYAIAAALYHRARTGEGQRIDTSLFASALAIQYRTVLDFEAFDREKREILLATIAAARETGMRYADTLQYRTGLGMRHAISLYYRVYETKDSLIAVACLNNRQRRALRDVMAVDDPTVDGHVFSPQASNSQIDHERLIEVFEEKFRATTTADWERVLAPGGVPCVPVLLSEEVYDHEQVTANALIERYDHPVIGTVRQAPTPIRMSRTNPGHRPASPALSEHAHDILKWLGYSPEQELALKAAGVVRESAVN